MRKFPIKPRQPWEPKFDHESCNICFKRATELLQVSFTQWDSRCEDHGGRNPDPESIIRVHKRSSK